MRRHAAADGGGDFAAVLITGPGRAPPRVARTTPPGRVAGYRRLSSDAADARVARVPARRRRDVSTLRGARPFASLLAIGEAPAGLALVFFREPRVLVDDLELARQLALAARGAFERTGNEASARPARSHSGSPHGPPARGRLGRPPDQLVELAAALVEADAASVRRLEDDRLAIVVGDRTGPLGASSP